MENSQTNAFWQRPSYFVATDAASSIAAVLSQSSSTLTSLTLPGTHQVQVVRLSGTYILSFEPSPLPATAYALLHNVVDTMRDSPPTDNSHVDHRTADFASRFLVTIAAHNVPPPRVFSHGGDAVVFTWDLDPYRRRYVTLCEDEISALDLNQNSKEIVDIPVRQVHGRSLALELFKPVDDPSST